MKGLHMSRAFGNGLVFVFMIRHSECNAIAILSSCLRRGCLPLEKSIQLKIRRCFDTSVLEQPLVMLVSILLYLLQGQYQRGVLL
jgi:hypothetical protein